MDDIITVNNAEQIQAKIQKKVILTFFVVIIPCVAILLYIFNESEGLHEKPQLLYFLIALVLFVAAYYTKMFKFLQRKIICGVIVDININVVTSRAHAGTTEEAYTSKEVWELELFIKTDNGKMLQRVYIYKGSNCSLQINDRIEIYRFLDNPVKI